MTVQKAETRAAGAQAPATDNDSNALQLMGPVIRTLVNVAWPLLAVFILWELVVLVNGYSEFVMPRPLAVVGHALGHSEKFLRPAVGTALLSIPGTVLGLLLGSVLAIAVWSSSILDGLISPTTAVLRSIPVIAMLPVIGRLVGYNDMTIIIIVMLLSFFPAFVLVLSRLKQPAGSSEDVFRVLGASRLTTLGRLLLPQAIPGLLAAMRLTAPFGIGGVILGQFLLGTGGLGKLITDSMVRSDTLSVWVVACITTLVSILVFALTKWAEETIAPKFQ
jgi:ABC-type nitrate/sulfonate/bicarbonate transport system permease component